MAQITRTPIIFEKTSTNLLQLAALRSTTSSLPSTQIGDETYTVNDDGPLVMSACSILAKVGPKACLFVVRITKQGVYLTLRVRKERGYVCGRGGDDVDARCPLVR